MIDQNNDNTSFHDDAPSDQGMNKVIEEVKNRGLNNVKLSKGVVEDEDTDGDEYSQNLMDDAVEEDEFDFDPDNDDDFVFRE